MKMIINFALKALGLGKAVEALDGEDSKAYAAGVQQIMTGGATLLGGLSGYASEFVSAHGAADYLAIVQNWKHDTNAGLLIAGWALIQAGKAAIANRHATAKLHNAVEAKPETPPAP